MDAVDEFFYALGKGVYDVASIPALIVLGPEKPSRLDRAMCLIQLCGEKGMKCTVDDLDVIASVIADKESTQPYDPLWSMAGLALNCGMLSSEHVDTLFIRALSCRALSEAGCCFVVLTGRPVSPAQFLDFQSSSSCTNYTRVAYRNLRDYNYFTAYSYQGLSNNCSFKCGQVRESLVEKRVAPCESEANAALHSLQQMYDGDRFRRDPPLRVFQVRVYEDFCLHGMQVWFGPDGGVFNVPFDEWEKYYALLKVACKHAPPDLAWANTSSHAVILIENGLVTTVDEVLEKFDDESPRSIHHHDSDSYPYNIVRAMYRNGLKTPPGDLHQLKVNERITRPIAFSYLSVCEDAYSSGLSPDWDRDHLGYILYLPNDDAWWWLRRFYEAGLRPDLAHVNLEGMRKADVARAVELLMRHGMDYISVSNALAGLDPDVVTEAAHVLAFYEEFQRRASWGAFCYLYPARAAAKVRGRRSTPAAHELPELPPDVFRIIAGKLKAHDSRLAVLERVHVD